MSRKSRPRLRGALSKPAPISFTDLQKTLHEQSMAAVLAPKTKGAFGGVTRLARVARDAGKAPKSLLPEGSPVA